MRLHHNGRTSTGASASSLPISSTLLDPEDSQYEAAHSNTVPSPGCGPQLCCPNNNKVFKYYNHSLEAGYPKEIQDVFPGIPDHLDAAVECPKKECKEETIIFFKGDDLYYYGMSSKTVKPKKWPLLPHCTSAYRWLERYYCFHGHNFTRFHPLTGDVEPQYPKDARNYFMKCENFGHGGDYVDCNTTAHLDAVTSDDKGKAYAFRGKLYLHLDSQRDGWHAFPISSYWKEVDSNVDAVFFYDGKLYIIKFLLLLPVHSSDLPASLPASRFFALILFCPTSSEPYICS
ncbi:hemopexin-like [Conger conger]|uniref:hemopexin-like n=1 Tax=Conger conger TaxID=82655 RepID=UPI002A5A153B|nr:hemopexin-like [Conger conger]